jgi:hypothetical protein
MWLMQRVMVHPQLIAKYQRPFPGFDDSTREIVGHVRDHPSPC